MAQQNPDQRHQAQVDGEKEVRHATAGAQSAAQIAAEKTQHTVENGDFYETLTELNLSSEKFDWIEAELGPKTSPAHFIGNRSPQHEKRSMYLNANEAERVIAERNPGRLAAGEDWRLAVAQQTHRYDGKTVTTPMTQAQDRRVVRDSYAAVTDFQSNAVGGAGRKSVTEATSVNKVEKQQEESESRREQISKRLFG